MDLKELCFNLTSPAGISGTEQDACRYAGSLLSQYMPVSYDHMNNVKGRLEGSGKHILLDAHIDRIGLIVRGISEKGFILFDRCGGTDPRTLIGNEVTVFGEKALFGVVCSIPPHLSDGDDKLPKVTKMAIDVGLTKEEAEVLVFPGDRVVICSRQHSLLGDKIAASGLDDRAGVASLIRCCEILKENNSKANLTVMFSSREEIGGMGAKTGSFECGADEAIAVDVSFASSDCVKKDEGGELSKGPMIGFSPVLDHEMSKKLVSIAKDKEIPYQTEVMGRSTGTNADDISVSSGGIKTALVSIPLRSMHTPVEVISISDVENTARLLAEYIMSQEG